MRFGALLVATVLAAPARADVGPCDKLLEQGIRSYVSESTRNDFRRAAYESLCATLERASKDSTRDEAKRIFPKVVAEGEYDRVKLDGLRTAYCTLGKSLGANQRLYRKAAGTLRPRAVEAWRRCLDAAAGKYGPPIEIEQIDDYALSFTLRPAAHDLRSVRITMEGFDRCVGSSGAPIRTGPPCSSTSRSSPGTRSTTSRAFEGWRRSLPAERRRRPPPP